LGYRALTTICMAFTLIGGLDENPNTSSNNADVY